MYLRTDNVKLPATCTMSKTCQKCGNRCYGELCWLHKPKKPISRITRPKPGKHTIRDRAENRKFRDSNADYRGFYTCERCGIQTKSIDVDHIKTKGSRPDLRYVTSNKRLLCRSCHISRHNTHT